MTCSDVCIYHRPAELLVLLGPLSVHEKWGLWGWLSEGKQPVFECLSGDSGPWASSGVTVGLVLHEARDGSTESFTGCTLHLNAVSISDSTVEMRLSELQKGKFSGFQITLNGFTWKLLFSSLAFHFEQLKHVVSFLSERNSCCPHPG